MDPRDRQPALRVHTVPSCSPEHFVRLSSALLGGASPALLVAGLEGDALLLGRHQRAASALELGKVALSRVPLVRRLAGGRSLRAGEGTIGVALALPAPGALLDAPIPADKVMNRHVRGLLGGLRRATSVPVNYFGRDFLAGPGGAVAVLGQEGLPSGAVLLEAIVSLSRASAVPAEWQGYPSHSDPRASGPAPLTLRDLSAGVSFDAVARAIAEGHAAAYGCAIEDAPPPSPGVAPVVAEDESGLEESGVADVPIGFVEALCRHDGARVIEARLRGDFMAPSFVIRELEASLPGTPLEWSALGARVDAAFHLPYACLVGVRHMRVFPDAILAAAGRA